MFLKHHYGIMLMFIENKLQRDKKENFKKFSFIFQQSIFHSKKYNVLDYLTQLHCFLLKSLLDLLLKKKVNYKS
jgi:hypothetical protein